MGKDLSGQRTDFINQEFREQRVVSNLFTGRQAYLLSIDHKPLICVELTLIPATHYALYSWPVY